MGTGTNILRLAVVAIVAVLAPARKGVARCLAVTAVIALTVTGPPALLAWAEAPDDDAVASAQQAGSDVRFQPCSGLGGSPEGTLAVSTTPAGGTLASPAPIAAGASVGVSISWSTSDWTGLDKLLDCVFVDTDGDHALDDGELLEALSYGEVNPVNDGSATHSYVVPAATAPGTLVCDRARLSGQPTGGETTQKSNVVCFEVTATPTTTPPTTTTMPPTTTTTTTPAAPTTSVVVTNQVSPDDPGVAFSYLLDCPSPMGPATTTAAGVSFADGNATFVLADGGSVTFSGLAAGEVCAVAQTAPTTGYTTTVAVDGATPSPATTLGVTLDADGSQVDFVNVAVPAGAGAPAATSLVVTNQVSPDDPGVAFSYVADCQRHRFSEAGGTLSFTVADGGSTRLFGLPVGDLCTVTQTAPADGYTTTVAVDTGAPAADTTATAPLDADGARVDFVNVAVPAGPAAGPGAGPLTVVSSAPGAPPGTVFSYLVDCPSPMDPATATAAGVSFADGNATFVLADGGSVTFSGLPQGEACAVTQTGPADGYTTTVAVDGATPAAGTTANGPVDADGARVDFANVAVLADPFGLAGSETLPVALAREGDGRGLAAGEVLPATGAGAGVTSGTTDVGPSATAPRQEVLGATFSRPGSSVPAAPVAPRPPVLARTGFGGTLLPLTATALIVLGALLWLYGRPGARRMS